MTDGRAGEKSGGSGSGTTGGGGTMKAVFGGGCFWCTEAVFQDLKGVRSVLPGYAGGAVENPTYQQVCGGDTGHAEVVQIEYDPNEVSYSDLLSVFFATHDPTTVDRQGNDVGSQYRSVVFYEDEEQRRAAEEAIQRLEGDKVFGAPIVTQVEPLERFYEAEAYHRNYFRNNPDQPYCSVVIAPKVAKFRQKNMDRLRGRTRPFRVRRYEDDREAGVAVEFSAPACLQRLARLSWA